MIRLPLAVATVLYSALATAQESNVTTAANSMNVGVEYKAEWLYDDKGLSKNSDTNSNAVSTIDVSKARLVVSGLVSPEVDFRFKFDALNSTEPLHSGHIVYNKSLGSLKTNFAVGKMKVHQGGWDNRDNEFNDHVQGYYKRHFTVDTYAPMFALSVGLAGKATLQIINDVTTADDGEWNEAAHPTMVFGWIGDFGFVSPIIEYGTYDNNKSSWLGLGAKLANESLVATFDYKSDRVSHKEYVAGKATGRDDMKTALTLKVSYEVPRVGVPWFYYSSFDNKQYSDAATGKKDSKVNPSSVNADGKFIYSIDDNAQVLGLGMDFSFFTRNWVPFVALTSTSAKFADTIDATKEETKTANTVAVGCWGSI